MSELKACPFWFCEGDAVIGQQGARAFAVVCNDCGAEGPVAETEAGAAEKWNSRRPTNPTVRELVRAVKSVVRDHEEVAAPCTCRLCCAYYALPDGLKGE
jgi:hypothetical protein